MFAQVNLGYKEIGSTKKWEFCKTNWKPLFCNQLNTGKSEIEKLNFLSF